MYKNWLITYKIVGKDGNIIKDGKMRVKNKINDFVARCSLDDYMKKKYGNSVKLLIDSCVEDNDFMNIFNGIFNVNRN